MGGQSLAIPVIPSAEALAGGRRGGLIARMFGRQKSDAGDLDGAFHDISDPRLGRTILKDMSNYLKGCLPAPWKATAQLFSYMFKTKQNVYIRGSRESADQPMVYSVQIAFSGCGGLAEVSSDIACHWADLYYRANRNQVHESVLKPFGLMPHHNTSLYDGWIETSKLFLPTPDFGYAEFTSDASQSELAARFGVQPDWKRFELDGAEFDVPDPEPAEQLQEWLEANGVELMRDNQCRCQMCSPDFDVGAFYADFAR